jgi:hypothetical protein
MNASHLMMCTGRDNPSGMRKHEKANMQYARKSLYQTLQEHPRCKDGKPNLRRIISTTCRNSSQVLYSNGRSYGQGETSKDHRKTGRSTDTDIKRIILAHLPGQLRADPSSHSWSAIRIKPAHSLYLFYDPPFLALLCQDPSKSSIICRSPESKVEKEESL